MYQNPITLANTDNPLILVPGDPVQVWRTARACQACAEKFDAIGNELKRVDRISWGGPAADAFRRLYECLPAKWFKASDIFGEQAAPALDSHAHTLEWSQREAREAVASWKEGVRRTKEAAATNPILLTNLSNDSTLSALGLTPKLHVSGDPGAELRARALSGLDRARRQLAASGDRAMKTLQQALDESPIKPSWFGDLVIAAEAFLHYLGSSGEARCNTVRNYRWPAMKLSDFGMKVSEFAGREDGVYETPELRKTFTPTDFQGKMVVGQLTFTLTGDITVNGSHWEFYGEAVPDVDLYDFDAKGEGGRTTEGESLTTVGRKIGDAVEISTFGILQPKAYNRTINGGIPIYEKGSF